MVATHKTVKVTPESKVDELLSNADSEPILLERGGAVYRLSRMRPKENDIWEGYQPDPEAVSKMLDEVAGTWSDLDVDRIIADIYDAREKGSRPADRP
jgi:hypothetical protein